MREDDLRLLEQGDLSLLETLDHVLNRGLVISGEVLISVAGIDLIYMGLNVLIGSVETIREALERRDREAEALPPPSDSEVPVQDEGEG